ncbi:Versicolorin reductase [Cytospora mali]|uniref:Versicolorin reductase n=1 Tax=Cytospora mali TaxID=578113 RepID=A0A194WDJ7_CYTMA|nr:Versicolorin reductase [Valsa mali]
MTTSASSRVAIIFGSGSNVGAALAKSFLGAGYRVATVSRSAAPPPGDPNNNNNNKPFHIQADLTDPAAAPGALARLTSSGWPFPSVIVWNAAALTPPGPSDPENPFAIPGDAFDRDVGLMVKSPFVVAGEAVKAWKEGEGEEGEGGGRRGTFIMTGNMTPRRIFPPALTTLGVGKSGANYWVGTADAAFKGEGIRFFFADERSPDGGPVGNKPNGESTTEMYLKLIEGKEDYPYYVTFFNGKYHEFN